MTDAALIAELTARLDRLEAQNEIRRVMTQYMRLCDHLEAADSIAGLFDLFTEDATWSGAGERYESAFGSHRGREAILAMLETYRSPPHFVFNAHFLTSEKISVTGDSAEASWMMLQTATYSSGASDLRSALLNVTLRLDKGRWSIRRFSTESLFSRSIDRWSDPAPVSVPKGAHK